VVHVLAVRQDMNQLVKIIFYSLVVLLTASCSQRIIDDSSLSEIDYITTSTYKENQSEWAEERYGKANIFIQSIKSTKQVDGYFPRYWIRRESYSSHDEALFRLENIREVDPSVPDETSMSKSSVWNEGFVIGSNIYIVSTDADVFGYRLIKEVKDKIQSIITEQEA